jgi:hypothetical protein
MTGETSKRNIQRQQAAALMAVVSSSRPGLPRERTLITEADTSEALERMLAFARRTLVLSFVCALLLAGTLTFANAASSATPNQKFSARLAWNNFVKSEARWTKLTYKFSEPSTSFSYRISFRNHSKWQIVKSVKKKGSFSGQKTITVKKLFGVKRVKIGSYRLKLSSDSASKLLKFKVVPFSVHLAKKSFTKAQAKSVKLKYALSKPSVSFSYRLSLKKGSKWQVVKTIKRKHPVKGLGSTRVRKLFAGKPIKIGTYRVKIACAYASKRLSFKILKSAKPAASAGGSTGTGDGNGNASTGGADFTITGGVSDLEPGLTLPIKVTLTNPNSVRIYVTRLTVVVSANSTPAGCLSKDNLVLTQSNASITSPIAIRAKKSVTLTSSPRAPKIEFLNLPTNQDVCKNASFKLTFLGSAHS